MAKDRYGPMGYWQPGHIFGHAKSRTFRVSNDFNRLREKSDTRKCPISRLAANVRLCSKPFVPHGKVAGHGHKITASSGKVGHLPTTLRVGECPYRTDFRGSGYPSWQLDRRGSAHPPRRPAHYAFVMSCMRRTPAAPCQLGPYLAMQWT
jgi:hypothetical protein